ncbi:hypothetical protein Taro_042641, partial [Colocasia esculenta]|nr:hypothetical protein [Colocasia esculenta]
LHSFPHKVGRAAAAAAAAAAPPPHLFQTAERAGRRAENVGSGGEAMRVLPNRAVLHFHDPSLQRAVLGAHGRVGGQARRRTCRRAHGRACRRALLQGHVRTCVDVAARTRAGAYRRARMARGSQVRLEGAREWLRDGADPAPARDGALANREGGTAWLATCWGVPWVANAEAGRGVQLGHGRGAAGAVGRRRAL